jgi:hypothetical protein
MLRLLTKFPGEDCDGLRQDISGAKFLNDSVWPKDFLRQDRKLLVALLFHYQTETFDGPDESFHNCSENIPGRRKKMIESVGKVAKS